MHPRRIRISQLRVRVAVGVLAVFAIALGAVDTWGRRDTSSTRSTSVVPSAGALAPAERGDLGDAAAQDPAGAAPMTTRQS